MEREDIISMAREAGFADGIAEFIGLSAFDKFAQLVADRIRSPEWLARRTNAAIAAEREACAKVCSDMHIEGDDDTGLAADAIRSRGQQ